MGDWCVTDHFVVGRRSAPKPRWSDAERWAMRAGVVGPGIVLVQTVEKWGGQRLAEDGVIGMCGPHDYLAGSAPTSFFAGWNYLLAPSCNDRDLFRGLADALGDGASIEAPANQRVLCLRTPLAYRSAHQTWKARAISYVDEEAPRLVDTFIQRERSLRGRDTELVCGLWTVEHGFIHTGSLTLALAGAREGSVTLTATAKNNPIASAWQGPAAGLGWLTAHQKPTRMALDRWPFAPVT